MPNVRNPLDLLLLPTRIVPVEPAGMTLHDHTLGIRGGQVALAAPREQTVRHGATEIHKLPDISLAPDLVNAHDHSVMSPFRGLADDLPLVTWLQDHIWPAEGQWASEDLIRGGMELTVAEQAKGGITCFSDMYFYPQAIYGVVHDSGIHAQVTIPMLNSPISGARDSAGAIRQGIALFDDLEHHLRIRIVFGPHAPYAVGDDRLEQILMLIEKFDTSIQMHVYETAFGVEQAVERSSERPPARLYRLDLPDPRFQTVHMTQVDGDDLVMPAETNSSVIHCSGSNLKLANDSRPMEKLWQIGVNVAIGTDDVASNNDLGLLGKTRTVVLLAKAVYGQATALDTHRALCMATLNGARALSLECLVGSLEAGKAVDLVVLDLSDLAQQPVYDLVSQLIYANGHDCMRHAWVDDRQLLDDGRLLRHDEQRLIVRAREWGVKVAASDRS